MEDNPYAAMSDMMREQRKTTLHCTVGMVSAVSPLSILIGGILFKGEELIVNEALLPHTAPVTIQQVDGSIITGTLKEEAGSLAVGDRVSLLTSDNQRYLVLCKVVDG